jgi:hypothetical protein
VHDLITTKVALFGVLFLGCHQIAKSLTEPKIRNEKSARIQRSHLDEKRPSHALEELR